MSAVALADRLRLDNVTIAVGDLAAMTHWYEAVLGFAVRARGRFELVGADYALLEGAGVRIELISRPGACAPVDRTAPPDHLAVLGYKAIVLETADLPAATQELVDRGVEVVWADRPVSADRRSTLVRDPEGNLINIFGPRLRLERPA